MTTATAFFGCREKIKEKILSIRLDNTLQLQLYTKETKPVSCDLLWILSAVSSFCICLDLVFEGLVEVSP